MTHGVQQFSKQIQDILGEGRFAGAPGRRVRRLEFSFRFFVHCSIARAGSTENPREKGRGPAKKMTNFGLVNPGAWPYVTLPIHGARAP
jgi:hypothetical protein